MQRTYTPDVVFQVDQQLAGTTAMLDRFVADHRAARTSLTQVAALHGLFAILADMDRLEVISLLLAAIDQRAEAEA